MTIRVALLGGSGFVGTRLARRLSSREGVTFIVLDKQKSDAFPSSWRHCDITDIESLRMSLKDVDVVVNLAAEHRDDVTPVSKYFDVNVEGQKNICRVMNELKISRHIFTSSVAVYGFVDKDTDESGVINPFNEYGRSKWEAEEVVTQWALENVAKQNAIVRPTVIFGEANRGNVYNLFRQISTRRFFMVGNGENFKSMAYVENIAKFLEFLIFNEGASGIVNFADKPDLNMNQLCEVIYSSLDKTGSRLRMPYYLGILIGYCFDFLAVLLRRKLSVSSVRVRKFCATTQFSSSLIKSYDYKAEVSLAEGIKRTISAEFLDGE